MQSRTGSLVFDPDPEVRYRMRPNAEFEILGHKASIAPDSTRKRPNPPPPGARNVLIVGDSVAFGYGLRDDETLAWVLEQILNDAAPEGSPPVAGFTLAAPGWNHRQATRFAADRIARFTPSIVVYLPISNDLYDADGVGVDGERRSSNDLAQPDPWLVAPQNSPSALIAGLVARAARSGTKPSLSHGGPEAMTAALSRESLLRYEANAASIAHLELATTRQGGRFFVAEYVSGPYTMILKDLCVARSPTQAWIPMFSRIAASMTLENDPHPNAATVQAMAILLARRLGPELFGSQFHEQRLPPIPPLARETLAATLDAAARRAALDEARADALEALRGVFDSNTLEGVRQVYGGLNPDGSVGTRTKLILKRAGTTLKLRFEKLFSRPDLYPLSIDILVDDSKIGSVDLSASNGELETEAVFLLPNSPGSSVTEILLEPERTGLTPWRGLELVAAAALVRAEIQ